MLVEHRYRRGDIWEGSLTYKRTGREQVGVRPLLVLQPKEGWNNELIYVAAISASLKGIDFPFLQKILVDKPSEVHYEQVKTIDRKFFKRYLGRLSFKEYMAIDIHLPFSIGVSRSNFMHINDLYVEALQPHVNSDNNIYKCVITRIFSKDELFFTRKQLLDHFGMDVLPVLTQGVHSLSNFLKTLEGLKFLFLIESENMYNEP